MATESSTPPERSNTRIQIGNHFADIIINREHETPIYYWIAQQLGSAGAGQFLEERNLFTCSLATVASD